MKNVLPRPLLLLLGLLATGQGLPAPAQNPTPTEKQPTAPKTDLYGDPLPDGAIARMGSMRLRGGYEALAFSPDGKTVIATDRRAIRRWTVADGKPLPRTPLQFNTQGLLPSVTTCVLTRDGKTLAALALAADNPGLMIPRSLFVWDAVTGEQRCRIAFDKVYPRTFAVAISEDSTMVAAAFSVVGEESIPLWDARTGTELRRIRNTGPFVSALLFSRDGKILAAASQDLPVRLYETATGAELHKLPFADTSGRSRILHHWPMAFSPDGKRFVATDGVKTVKIWDVASGKEQANLNISTKGNIATLEYSPDGKMLAVKAEHTLVLWDVATQKPLRQWSVPSTSISSMRFSPDGKILASISAGNVLLWDVATGKRLHDWPGHLSSLTWVGVAPEGNSLLSISRQEGKLNQWDMHTGRLLHSLPLDDSALRGFVRSSGGKYAASSPSEGSLKVWQLPEGRVIRELAVESPASDLSKPVILSLQLSSDGTQLAAVARRHETRTRFPSIVHVWDVATGKQLVNRRLDVERNSFNFAFSPDGQTLVIPRQEDFILQDVRTGQERLHLKGHLGVPASFSADGQILSAVMYKPRDPGNRLGLGRSRDEIESVGFWELATGQHIGQVKTGPVAATNFAPGGRLLATAGTDALVLWDTATGKAVMRRPLEIAHVGVIVSTVTSLDFTPDGRFLASGMLDGSILVWDVAPATHPSPSPRVLEAKELERAWTDLGGDASVAWPAIANLTQAAPQTLTLFQERLRPAMDAPTERVRRLVSELDSSDFKVRDTASRELDKLGDLAVPALRHALDDNPALEMRQRIETLLAAARFVHQPEALRRLRVIHVLEQIGTPEARILLHKLRQGSKAARETAAAARALKRAQR